MYEVYLDEYKSIINNIDDLIEYLDYVFINHLVIANVKIENLGIDKYIDNIREYFPIRNILVMERSSMYESRELSKSCR